jgi:hypothetical protein
MFVFGHIGFGRLLVVARTRLPALPLLLACSCPT